MSFRRSQDVAPSLYYSFLTVFPLFLHFLTSLNFESVLCNSGKFTEAEGNLLCTNKKQETGKGKDLCPFSLGIPKRTAAAGRCAQQQIFIGGKFQCQYFSGRIQLAIQLQVVNTTDFINRTSSLMSIILICKTCDLVKKKIAKLLQVTLSLN